MSLPGNVHHEIASTLGIKDDDTRAVVESMLAVAWEQRTANLIAVTVGNPTALSPLLGPEIYERLGLPDIAELYEVIES